jgi:hypothetical protein
MNIKPGNYVFLQVQHYIFVVQAQDTGRPSLSSTVTVYFNVLDLNDNAPLFDPMSYSDELYENITIGSSVITVSATDQDSGRFEFLRSFCDHFSKNSLMFKQATMESWCTASLVETRTSNSASPKMERL